MNTFAKLAYAPALALFALTPVAAVHAGESGDDIVVTTSAAMQEWQAGAARSLDRALERNPFERFDEPGSGVVQVTFTSDADGRAENIAVYNATASSSAIRSAKFAVRRLSDLDRVPVRNPEGATFLANIIFAKSQDEHDEIAAALLASERTRLASGTPQSTFIALGN